MPTVYIAIGHGSVRHGEIAITSFARALLVGEYDLHVKDLAAGAHERPGATMACCSDLLVAEIAVGCKVTEAIGLPSTKQADLYNGITGI